MKKYVIRGGKPLEGEVRISGGKNAAVAIIPATLLVNGVCIVENVPAVNDVILIVLWTLASISDIRYISVVVCFVAFLFNDVYGFISWQRMKSRQCE